MFFNASYSLDLPLRFSRSHVNTGTDTLPRGWRSRVITSWISNKPVCTGLTLPLEYSGVEGNQLHNAKRRHYTYNPRSLTQSQVFNGAS